MGCVLLLLLLLRGCRRHGWLAFGAVVEECVLPGVEDTDRLSGRTRYAVVDVDGHATDGEGRAVASCGDADELALSELGWMVHDAGDHEIGAADEDGDHVLVCGDGGDEIGSGPERVHWGRE